MSGAMVGAAGCCAASNGPRLPANISIAGSNSGGTAQAILRLQADGDIERTISLGGTADIGDWINKPANGSLWEARYTVTGGAALDFGTAGVWQALSSDRAWGIQAGITLKVSSGLLEIRPAGGGATVASCTVDLEADGTP